VNRREALGAIAAAVGGIPLRRPLRAQGVTVNVRDFGAVANGVANDAPAFARAIAAVPARGGRVIVPAGRYGLRLSSATIRLASGIAFEMDAEAELLGLPGSDSGHALLLADTVSDVRISGGRLTGDRAVSPAAPGERPRGMGIRILGASGVTVDGTRIDQFRGDGVYVGRSDAPDHPMAQHIVVANCTVSRCRRHGITLTGCVGGEVRHCTVTDCGEGSEWGSGIRIEPNQGWRVEDVTVTQCVLNGNRGFAIHLGGTGKGIVRNIRIASNRTTANAGGVHVLGGAAVRIDSNQFSERNTAVRLRGRADVDLDGNVCQSGRVVVDRGSPRPRVTGGGCPVP
jgi:polygalacturonase